MTDAEAVTPVEISPLTAEETEAAVALWQEAGLLVPWNDPRADIAAAVAHPTATVLAARDGDRVVATVMAGYDGHRGWLYYVAVAQSHRGQGLGRTIVEAAEAWLRGEGANVLRLMVRVENATALGFYRALGYDDGELTVMGKRFD
jgi:ribosomal protein S18 acetylase RimI-like enzyme